MIDINSFLIMIICILSSILLVVLIVLGIKLINTITKVDSIMTDVELRIRKLDKLFNMVDVVTDGMALVSDKLVDSIAFCINKLFVKKDRRESDYDSEQE